MAGAEEPVRRSKEEEMRSGVTPFNLEDETVGPLDVLSLIHISEAHET